MNGMNGLTVNWLMNLDITAGYVAVAVVAQAIRFPIPYWRLIAACISLFFLGCAMSHGDLGLHAFTRTPLTVDHMGDVFHIAHLAIQAVTVWPAVIGLLMLRRWINGLLAKIDTLEALVVEGQHRRDPGSEWGPKPNVKRDTKRDAK